MAETAQPGVARQVVIVGPQSGQAVRVRSGAQIRVVDVDGHQVGDMWAIDAADPGRWLSASHTRDRCERLFPRIGEPFADQHGEPILQLVADTSPRLHDMLFPPCDPWLYESRGLPGHLNCRDNFLAALASAGVWLPVVPDPVNLFQNSDPQPDGCLAVGVAASLPGDSISFRAQRDLVFVLTACSVDYPPLNNGRCGPLRIEVAPPVGLELSGLRTSSGRWSRTTGHGSPEARAIIGPDLGSVAVEPVDSYWPVAGLGRYGPDSHELKVVLL